MALENVFRAGFGLPALSLVRGSAEAGAGGDVVAITLFVSVLCACIIVGHMLEEHRWINESVTAILFGLLSGMGVLIYSRGESSHILEFNEELFFIYLLPPIIFNAGFQVKKKQFFRNILAINAFGVLGVFISFVVISAGCLFLFQALGLEPLEFKDYLTLGVIFSATDSVCTLQVLNQDEQPLLYSLVFGEGVVNDATAVVLFRAIQSFNFSDITLLSLSSILGDFLYLFFASTALGVLMGLLSAYIIRTLYIGWHSTDREIALMGLMAYLSYVLSELAELSGILTVFFCGIVMSHYTWHNVTESSRVTTKHAFATMSFIAETFIFVYVGMDTMNAEKWERTYPREGVLLFLMVLGLTLLGRAAFVFPLSAVLNTRRKGGQIITLRQQVVVWWAGLMRGAVSIALVFNAFIQAGKMEDRKYSTIVSTTVALVLFSTMVFGLLTRPLIDWLLPQHPGASLSREDSLLSDQESPKNGAGLEEHLLPGTREAEGEGDREALEEARPSRLYDELTAIESNGLPPIRAAVARSKTRIGALLGARERDIHHLWRHFDDSYMRPLFGGRGFVPYTPVSPTVMEAKAAPAMPTGDFPLEEGAVPRIDSVPRFRRPLSRFDIATSVDEGLAENDPAWPEDNHHNRHDRWHRGDSPLRDSSVGRTEARGDSVLRITSA